MLLPAINVARASRPTSPSPSTCLLRPVSDDHGRMRPGAYSPSVLEYEKAHCRTLGPSAYCVARQPGQLSIRGIPKVISFQHGILFKLL